MRFVSHHARRAAGIFACAAMLLLGTAGAGLAQKPWKGDKHALHDHRKAEKRELKEHQRYERRYYGNNRTLREHEKAERRELKRHGRWEKSTFRDRYQSGRYDNGRRMGRFRRRY